MPFKKEENNEALDNIMDTFAGADGGIRFIKFKFGMEHFEKEGSEASELIMDVMIKFSKLIDIMNRRDLQ